MVFAELSSGISALSKAMGEIESSILLSSCPDLTCRTKQQGSRGSENGRNRR